MNSPSSSGNPKQELLGGPWPLPRSGRTVPTRKLLPKAKSQSGQVIVVVAVVLVGMIAILGLVMGSGKLQGSRRQAQRAADAAAQAGAFELLAGTNSTQRANAQAAALQYAALNGIATNNVLIEIPPAASSSSAYAGSNAFIRVEVTLPTKVGLMSLFLNMDTANVRASSTAGVPPQPYDLTVVLLGQGSGNLSTSGSSSMSLGNGSLRVNSSDSQAVQIGGSSSVQAATARITGGVSGTINGNVATGAPPIPDPFADRSWPNQSSYSMSSDSGGSIGNPQSLKITGSSAVTLHPGIYYGGIEISGSGPVTLLAGTYIIAGGGIKITGSASFTGTDVFIYNTQDNLKPNGNGAYGPIALGGTGDLDLKAPTQAANSTYYGFSIVNDPANTQPISLKGTSTGYDGVVYAKNSTVSITGNGTLGPAKLVAKALSVQGNATFGTTDPNRIPQARVTVALME